MKITIIACTKNRDTEIYFEPRTPRAEIALLREKGWTVKTKRVEAESEIARIQARADAMASQSAALAGSSSLTHAFALGSGAAESVIAKIRAAANGKGSLVD